MRLRSVYGHFSFGGITSVQEKRLKSVTGKNCLSNTCDPGSVIEIDLSETQLSVIQLYDQKKTPVSHFLRFTAKQAAWHLLLEKPFNNQFNLQLQTVLQASVMSIMN